MFQLSPLSSGTDISPPCKLPGTLIQLVLLPDLSENTVTMVKAAVMMTKMRQALARTLSGFWVFFFSTKSFVEELIPSLLVQMKKLRQDWDVGVNMGQQRPLQSDMPLNVLRNKGPLTKPLNFQGHWSFSTGLILTHI